MSGNYAGDPRVPNWAGDPYVAQTVTAGVLGGEPLDDLHITGRVARQRDQLREQVTELAEEVGDLRAIVAELTGAAVFQHTAGGNWSALISDAELNNFRERAGLEPRSNL